MQSECYIKFLGTAGARHVVARQLRASGGTFIHAYGQNIILDPGPGCLVKLASSRPAIDVTKLDAIIVSHAHIDHSNDVNALIDAMTAGGFDKKGRLFCPRDCLTGDNAVVLKYLRSYLDEIIELTPDTRYKLGDLQFRTSVAHDHSVETYGLKFDINGQKISFLTDTKFFPQLLTSYKDSDVLVINVVRNTPHASPDVRHLSIDDVKTIVTAIKPKLTLLTHFGMTMLHARPRELAEKLSKELNADIRAASDGLRIDI